MSCSHSFASTDEIEKLKNDISTFNIPQPSRFKPVNAEVNFVEDPNNNITPLKRGGCRVNTSIGPIQYGLPPETVKDSLTMGLEVPTYYIIPTVRFDKTYGINVAEFEFPAYFNFFVKKKHINLICTKEAEKAIRIVFRETLIGPENHSKLHEEFYYSYDKEGIPDFPKERSYFAKNPLNPSELVTVDTLLKFTIIDDQSGMAYLDNDVAILKEEGYFTILDQGIELAKIKDVVELGFVEDDACKYIIGNPYRRSQSGLNVSKVYKAFREFTPPYFGVTVLGCSHGFDPSGSTSGYIFWVNGRGIMIDPPPFSTNLITKYAVPSSLIESIIISHCHADHDAGVFQKILENQRVEIITTRTIMESFIRKYSALSGMSDTLLRKLFKFRPVIIGAPMMIHNAEFRFFYSLHTIPCLGFEVFYGERSIYFSGDTYYDPQKMVELVKLGLMTQRRYEMLANIKWNYNLIIHEAGVPPIHTPLSALMVLPPSVRSRFLLVHIAQKDIPPSTDLKVAKSGFENTIVLDVVIPKTLPIYKKIDLLSGIEVFQNLSIKNARDLIQVSTEENYLPGQIIIKEGTCGNKFYIIEQGVVKIWSNSENATFERYAVYGDYFGESALITSGKRLASVEAVTDIKLFVIEKHDFWFVFGEDQGNDSSVIKKLLNLSNVRNSKAHSVIIKNSYLSDISQCQKTQLEMILKEVEVKEMEVLWNIGDEAKFAFIIAKGAFRFFGCKEADLDEFRSGVLIGEINAILNNTPLTTSIRAVTDSVIYRIEKKDLKVFLSHNPGLFLILSDLKYCE